MNAWTRVRMATVTRTTRPSSPVACPQPYLIAYGFSRTTEGHTSLWPQGIPCGLTVYSSSVDLLHVFVKSSLQHPQNPLKKKSTDLWLIPWGSSYFCLFSVWLPSFIWWPLVFVLGHTVKSRSVSPPCLCSSPEQRHPAYSRSPCIRAVPCPIILIVSKFFFPFSTIQIWKQGGQYYIYSSRHREIVVCASLSGMLATYVLATSFKIWTTITTATYSESEKL